MNHFQFLHRRYAALVGLLAALLSLTMAPGCAKAPWTASLARDISPVRETRGVEAAEKFEAFRNQAQFQAACARWQDGDAKACEQMLQAVLQRSPDHYESRLTLADLYVATDRPDLAEQELQKLLERDPHDPQVHHSLGLLLESTGRTREALAHVKQAVQLDAKNELYTASEETLLAATRPSSPPSLSSPTSPSTAKLAGPVLASLRDVSPRIAATPRSRIKTVAHHEPTTKSSKPTLLASPTSFAKPTTNSVVPISRVADEEPVEQPNDTSPPLPAKPAHNVSTAPSTPSVSPVVIAAPEPLFAPDDKPPTIQFRVESE